MKRLVLLGVLAVAWACGGAGGESSATDVPDAHEAIDAQHEEAPDDADDDLQKDGDDIPPEVAPEVEPEAAAEVEPDVAVEVTPEATPEVTPEVTPEIEPECATDADCEDRGLEAAACEHAVCAGGTCQVADLPDGAACDDGNLCTTDDHCEDGDCVPGGGEPCYPVGDCQVSAACDPATGACVAVNAADGAPCDDHDACTRDEACLAGACAGGVPAVACEAPEPCHEPGICEPATGACSYAQKPDETPCDDGDACTAIDTCEAGACLGTSPKPCYPVGDCQVGAACDPATGACTPVLADDGAPCDDGDACTLTDTCLQGACASGTLLTCDPAPACRQPGVCDPGTGNCAYAPVDDGSACDDGNALNGADACSAGGCVGAPCTCAGENVCCNGCLPITEHQAWLCDDGDACTAWDTCDHGACVGDYPVLCEPPAPCHAAGVCDPATGACGYAPLDDGASCTDGDPCSDGDACLGGACTPASTRDCADANPCTVDTCSATDCVHTPVPGCVPEFDCTNDGDDNDNGLIDCDDPHCAADPACTERPAGDVCRTAHLVNDGAPVTAALAGQMLAYAGDTTGLTNDYACVGDLGAPDDTWALTLAAPLVVTVTLDFAGEPGAHPWGVVSLYPDRCWPLDVLACEAGDLGAEDESTFTRGLPPGRYYVVVDGLALDDGDVGAYALTFAFAAPPAIETVCDDGLDDDLNGATDCFDPACNGAPACDDCPIVKELACGDTVTGQLVSPADRQHYLFTTPTATDVAFTMAVPPAYKDQLNLNFLEHTAGTSCDNLYSVGGVTIWHTSSPRATGFRTKAGETYLARAHISESTWLTGEYAFTFTCNTEPESACADHADNDADSLADCEDPDCFADPACTGGATGETCADPFVVNAGAALTLADVGDGRSFLLYNTTAGKTDHLDAACLPPSSTGPDLVVRFTLADTLEVSAFVEQGALADPWGAPGVYVFGAECVPAALEGCGESYLFFDFGFAAWGSVLPPGTYHAVVDSGATGLDGKPDAGAWALDLWFGPPPNPEICGNGLDDEGDDRVDCRDPECFDHASCTGGHAGEDCADPLPLKAGALVPGDTLTAWNTTLGRADDLAGSCSTFTNQCPDTTHGFTLASEAVVTATVTFENGFSPALVLFPASACTTAAELACDRQGEPTATVTKTLAAGAYVLSVDGGDSLTGWLDGPPAASTYRLEVSVAAP